jgi:hypothetical protein
MRQRHSKVCAEMCQRHSYAIFCAPDELRRFSAKCLSIGASGGAGQRCATVFSRRSPAATRSRESRQSSAWPPRPSGAGNLPARSFQCRWWSSETAASSTITVGRHRMLPFLDQSSDVDSPSSSRNRQNAPLVQRTKPLTCLGAIPRRRATIQAATNNPTSVAQFASPITAAVR